MTPAELAGLARNAAGEADAARDLCRLLDDALSSAADAADAGAPLDADALAEAAECAEAAAEMLREALAAIGVTA